MMNDDLRSLLEITADCCVFVRDLPYHCTEEELRLLFASRGRVMSVKIAHNDNKQNMFYGTVVMATPQEAYYVVQELNGFNFQGRRLKVYPYEGAQRHEIPEPAQLYFTYECKTRQISKFTEEIIVRHYGEFGELSFIGIREHKVNRKGCVYGYGFMSYEDPNDAFVAIKSRCGVVVENVLYDCKWSKDFVNAASGGGGGRRSAPAMPPSMPSMTMPRGPSALASMGLGGTVSMGVSPNTGNGNASNGSNNKLSFAEFEALSLGMGMGRPTAPSRQSPSASSSSQQHWLSDALNAKAQYQAEAMQAQAAAQYQNYLQQEQRLLQLQMQLSQQPQRFYPGPDALLNYPPNNARGGRHHGNNAYSGMRGMGNNGGMDGMMGMGMGGMPNGGYGGGGRRNRGNGGYGGNNSNSSTSALDMMGMGMGMTSGDMGFDEASASYGRGGYSNPSASYGGAYGNNTNGGNGSGRGDPMNGIGGGRVNAHNPLESCLPPDMDFYTQSNNNSSNMMPGRPSPNSAMVRESSGGSFSASNSGNGRGGFPGYGEEEDTAAGFPPYNHSPGHTNPHRNSNSSSNMHNHHGTGSDLDDLLRDAVPFTYPAARGNPYAGRDGMMMGDDNNSSRQGGGDMADFFVMDGRSGGYHHPNLVDPHLLTQPLEPDSEPELDSESAKEKERAAHVHDSEGGDKDIVDLPRVEDLALSQAPVPIAEEEQLEARA